MRSVPIDSLTRSVSVIRATPYHKEQRRTMTQSLNSVYRRWMFLHERRKGRSAGMEMRKIYEDAAALKPATAQEAAALLHMTLVHLDADPEGPGAFGLAGRSLLGFLKGDECVQADATVNLG